MLCYEKLYIFWFLHQTTTCDWYLSLYSCCISFDSYIKPQQVEDNSRCVVVVYLLIPTSNHNYCYFWVYISRLYIFWFLHQTTTRNLQITFQMCCISFDSYIKPQPIHYDKPGSMGCISFDSYIKPQPWCDLSATLSVVYLLIPTSNHNLEGQQYYETMLYIFWFLHQTTT